MRVGDILITTSGKTFRITGVYLGGERTQSMVGLSSLAFTKGHAIDEMLVPVELVLSAEIYRRI